MNLLKFLIAYFTKQKYEGALIDNRSAEEKAKDWQAREIFAFGAPQFRSVPMGGWKRYTVRSQNGSGSCVAQSQNKFIEIMEFLKTGQNIMYSATPVYQKRANKPQAGMGFPDAPKLQTTVNTCHENVVKSQDMTDAQMDSAVLPPNYEDLNDEAKPNSWVVIDKTFSDVAAYVESKGAAIIWIVSDYANWNKPIPTVGGKANGEVRHSICVVDAVTVNGVKYLIVEDSWGTGYGINGSRMITKEFFDDAVYHAYALTQFTFEVTAEKFEPFTVLMQYKQISPEIARLQRYLKSRGFFPKETQESGRYLNITAQAVLNWQLAKQVDNPIKLNQWKGKNFGAKSLAIINQNL